jgi:AbrB family looped-hinge helix DNA binding protein
MPVVTVSSKFQVVIPKEIRERAGIRPGEKLEMLSIGDRIELVRVRPMREIRGYLKGRDSTFVREEDDRI